MWLRDTCGDDRAHRQRKCWGIQLWRVQPDQLGVGGQQLDGCHINAEDIISCSMNTVNDSAFVVACRAEDSCAVQQTMRRLLALIASLIPTTQGGAQHSSFFHVVPLAIVKCALYIQREPIGAQACLHTCRVHTAVKLEEFSARLEEVVFGELWQQQLTCCSVRSAGQNKVFKTITELLAVLQCYACSLLVHMQHQKPRACGHSIS